MKKIYTVRKFVVAESIEEAIKKEKKTPPDEIYLDDFDMKMLKEKLSKKT